MEFNTSKLVWTNKPVKSKVNKNSIEISTQPGTDLWQRTYYKFRNDNAPMLQMSTEEKEFSFITKVEFNTNSRFDQAGVVVYLDSENWIKASVEYGDVDKAYLGAVVTNKGYSDWSTNQISSMVKSLWFRLSRRDADFCIEVSYDGVIYEQLRICHLLEGEECVDFGVYACSPENGSFTAKFTEFEAIKCVWPLHDGQQPDKDM